ncbi:MAG TPA: hypothetical protein VHK27_08885, partial [Gammaproteobacteria bacterium]|nr:hypothetical protein [Gammaproteobacteria bacterium]
MATVSCWPCWTATVNCTQAGNGSLIGRRHAGFKPDRHQSATARTAIARRALHASIELRTGDLSCAELPPCQAVTLLDVLFLMTPREQQALIARITAALQPSGLL